LFGKPAPTFPGYALCRDRAVGGPLGLYLRHFLERDRRPEQIALHLVTAERREIALLVDRLDTLRRRGHAERAGDADHRLYDDDVLVAFAQIRDERAIDLDLVERKAAQVAQRRVAGAEVVERNADTERLELVQDRQRVLAILHEDPLGDFELEPARCQSGFG